MERLLALEDPRAADPAVAGAKASGLARAMAAGLPVLPGAVLPVAAAAAAIRSGVDALERSSVGAPELPVAAAAVLAVSRRHIRGATLTAIRSAAEALGRSLIVRSSSIQEADPRWAGAFATYPRVAPEDLATAVRGCWASVFGRDALGRARAMGRSPGDVGMAVLLQPWMELDGGGTAAVGSDGRVLVSAMAGSPEALVDGHADGAACTVGPGGDVEGDGDVAGLGAPIARAAADLTRAVRSLSGHPFIEWGVAGGEIVLLQVRPGAVAPADEPPTTRVLEGSLPAMAERLAFLATRFPSPLGDELVLPWILGLGVVPAVPHVHVDDPATAIADLRLLTERLMRQAWGVEAQVAADEAARAIRTVLGPDPADGVARMSSLRPVDPAAAARLLGTVAGLGRALLDRGVLGDADDVWRLGLAEIERASGHGGAELPPRRGANRWEAFVGAVVSANGRTLRGRPAAAGCRAGRLRVLHGPPSAWRSEPGHLLALGAAVPQVSPLLWESAGLICASGNPGAHVFEVARSLGVPAVVGVDVRDHDRGALVAVDGSSGAVWVLEDRWKASERIGA